METQALSLVDFLGQYGVLGLLGVMIIAIIYLYKQQTSLAKEMRESIEKYASGLAACQASSAEMLKSATQALEDNTRALQTFVAYTRGADRESKP